MFLTLPGVIFFYYVAVWLQSPFATELFEISLMVNCVWMVSRSLLVKQDQPSLTCVLWMVNSVYVEKSGLEKRTHLQLSEILELQQLVLGFITALHQDKSRQTWQRGKSHNLTLTSANIFISLNWRRWLHGACFVIDRIKDATEYQIVIRLFCYRLLGSFRDIVFFARPSDAEGAAILEILGFL